LFGDRLRQMRKPNLFGLPLGHNGHSESIPLGVRCEFDSVSATIEFESGAVA